MTASGSRMDIDGGTGADTMQGGAGDDTYIVDEAGDIVIDGGNSNYKDSQRRGAWLGSIATADLMRRGPFWSMIAAVVFAFCPT